MKSSEWTSPAHSGEGEIFSRLWAHEEPKAVLLLVHGMAEHSARYADFGSFLAENGFAVFMNDHAGHGRSAVVQGHFADHDGWEHVLADLHRLEADARTKYPGLPVFIFGHSMGSFLTREYIARWGGGLSAAVVCGTMGANPLLGFARALASLQAAVKGPKSPGKLIESLSTGGYLNAQLTGFIGSATISLLEPLLFAKAFIGAEGVDLQTSAVLAYNMDDGSVKQRALQNASYKFLLADRSKFRIHKGYRFASVNDFTAVITDETDPDILRAIVRTGTPALC